MELQEILLVLTSILALSMVLTLGYRLYLSAVRKSESSYCIAVAETINSTCSLLYNGQAVIYLPRLTVIKNGKVCGIYPTKAIGTCSGLVIRVEKSGNTCKVRR